jgi:hypothetical protein
MLVLHLYCYLAHAIHRVALHNAAWEEWQAQWPINQSSMQLDEQFDCGRVDLSHSGS